MDGIDEARPCSCRSPLAPARFPSGTANRAAAGAGHGDRVALQGGAPRSQDAGRNNDAGAELPRRGRDIPYLKSAINSVARASSQRWMSTLR